MVSSSNHGIEHVVLRRAQDDMPVRYTKKHKREKALHSLLLHIAVKLLLPVHGAEFLALEGFDANEALVGLAYVVSALAEQLHEPRFLHLGLESLLQAVVAFIAVPVCVDRHRAGKG
jgi:hypothetical protein